LTSIGLLVQMILLLTYDIRNTLRQIPMKSMNALQYNSYFSYERSAVLSSLVFLLFLAMEDNVGILMATASSAVD
jgi:hypothetical protein